MINYWKCQHSAQYISMKIILVIKIFKLLLDINIKNKKVTGRNLS